MSIDGKISIFLHAHSRTASIRGPSRCPSPACGVEKRGSRVSRGDFFLAGTSQGGIGQQREIWKTIKRVRLPQRPRAASPSPEEDSMSELSEDMPLQGTRILRKL